MKAVIFDLDNTLIKSFTDYVKMKKEIIAYLRKVGVESEVLTPKHTTVEMVKEAARQLKERGKTEEEIASVMVGVNEVMNRVELENVDRALPLNGAEELLKTLKEAGVKVGILTRGCESYARGALKVTGLLSYVDAINARVDLLQAKPNPKALLDLCRKLEVDPSEVIFVGDHPIDVICANVAGVKFIGVLEGFTSEEKMRQIGSRINFKNLLAVKEYLIEKIEEC